MALFLCVVLCAFAGVLGFNLDIPSRVVYKGNYQSMFGFTVQSHIDGDKKMILVGAPEDEPYPISGVTRPGAVYRCDPDYRGYSSGDKPLEMCSVMVFDKIGTNFVDSSQRQIDQKSNQWFGATLTSTGRNGPIVACAPRYVSFVTAKLNKRNPVGTCYMAKTSDAIDVKEYSPCRTSSHRQHITGMCQAGFSAAIAKDGQRLFMGAPGSFFWQGQMFSINPSREFLYFMPTIKEGEGQLYEFGQGTRPTVLSTPEASVRYDDSYMGYSVTVGDFAGQGVQGVAVGVPRGSDLKGLVVLYTWELHNIKNISGSQIGAYFGYSLASGDIDGDGADDVIVGAPMFTKPESDGYEHGRIYVIYQGKDRLFKRSHARTGEVSRGRFGLAITSLGDINYDGFGDIAVGAPYGGENGRGVVYIYHGSELGIREKYSQAITAEEIAPGLSTFGFSLSGGVDLDNNNYTDLAVGAYKSDSVVFLKARPVVKMTAEVRFMGESKLISMTDKRCRLNNGTYVSCARLMFCLTYDGVNVDQRINFKVMLDLDSRLKASKRLFLMETRETTYTVHIQLTQGVQECREINVYLADDIRDKLTPIEVKMTYDLVNQPSSSNFVPPVLDQTTSIEHTDSLNIQKNCGPDNVCVPDMRLAVTTPTVNYLLGSGENVQLNVKVENTGEDAFEAAFYLEIPAGVTYAKMERLDENPEESPIYCSLRANNTLKCDLGNPMGSRQKVKFRVILEVDARVTKLSFNMEANSTNPERENTRPDNVMRMNIGVLVMAKLSIIGTSDPPELHYNASLYEVTNLNDDTKLGPQVIHKYNMKNEGPFNVDEAEIYIMWPYQTLTGENLMYMLVEPQWAGNVHCDVARHINPANLLIQNPYANLLYKEIEAMKSSDTYTQQFVGGSSYYTGTNINSGTTGEKEYVNRQVTGSQNSNKQFISAHGSSNARPSGQVSHGSGGQSSWGSSSYNRTWSNSWSGLTLEQQEAIKRNLAAQTGRSYQGYQESRTYWEGLSATERENIRRRLIAAMQGYGNEGYQGWQHEGGANREFVRVKNRTIVYDSNGNIVSETESSTEYNNLGHEGEHGSSFNKYNQGAYQQGTYQQGSYQQGNYHRQQQSGSSQSSHQGGQGFVHGSWATTETVNSDVMRAGSSTYRGAQGVTYVGDENDEIGGFGANAARGSNGEFRYGIGDVSNVQGAGGAQGAGAARGGSVAYGSGSSVQSGSAYGGRTGGGYYYSSSSSSSSGYNTAQERRENTRRRRQDQVDPQLKEMLEKCEEKYKCEVFRCSTGPMMKGQEVWIALRSRINASVLNEISKDRPVILSTFATTRVTSLPTAGKPSEQTWERAEAKTIVTPQLEALESGSIPMWVVVLAAVVGALLLLLLIFLLYKCGFFKRNRPSDHVERQPLNGRDEHL